MAADAELASKGNNIWVPDACLTYVSAKEGVTMEAHSGVPRQDGHTGFERVQIEHLEEDESK